MSPKSYADDTMDDGWRHFAVDLVRQPGYDPARLAEYRQACKNAAAAVLSRGITHGVQALRCYVNPVSRGVDDARVLAEVVWPFWLHSQRIHPAWGELHRDAAIAGGNMGMVMLIQNGFDLARARYELDRFKPDGGAV